MAKMRKVKTAVSIDAELFRAAEERAGKMGVSRSELFGRALAKFVRDEESREMLARLNESYAEEPTEEDRDALRHLQMLQRQTLENGE